MDFAPVSASEGASRPVPWPTMEDGEQELWFGRKEGGLGFGPLTWQGRSAVFLYVFLVLVAVVLYRSLALIALVVAVYTIAFVLLVAFKSELMEHWPPGQ